MMSHGTCRIKLFFYKTKCLFTVYITTADETFIIAIHILSLAFIEDDTNIYSI